MNRPEKRKNMKTYCRACGEQVVFMWKDKPRFCAMCGDELDWTTEKTLTERLAEGVLYAEKNDSRYVHLDTADAKAILRLLETEAGQALMAAETETAAETESEAEAWAESGVS